MLIIQQFTLNISKTTEINYEITYKDVLKSYTEEGQKSILKFN